MAFALLVMAVSIKSACTTETDYGNNYHVCKCASYILPSQIDFYNLLL